MFSIASILTMAACIFLVGIFYSIVNNVDHIAHKVEQEVPITVFFDEGTTQEQIDAIGEQISCLLYTSGCKLILPESHGSIFL